MTRERKQYGLHTDDEEEEHEVMNNDKDEINDDE